VIKRIELINFMSHKHTVLEPGEGLTVLVGPNNCGKSAVVAAMQILCHNENSTYVTRHGEDECGVKVETSDGHKIEWSRKNGSPQYRIDGRLFDRLRSGGLPDELRKALRIVKVATEGGHEFDVHFGEQKAPVFLLDKPASHAAQFFASSSDAAKLVQMQALHRQRVTDARRDQTRLEAEAERLNQALEALSPMPEIDERVKQAERNHSALIELAARIEGGTADETALRRLIGLVARHEAAVRALACLATPPQLEPTELLEQVIVRIELTSRDLECQTSRAMATNSLTAPPKLDDTRPLNSLIEWLEATQLTHDAAAAAMLAIQALLPLPKLHDVATLALLVDQIVRSERLIERIEGDRVVMAHLVAAPELQITAPLETMVRQLEVATKRAMVIARQFATLAPLTEAPELENEAELFVSIRNLERARATVRCCAEVHDRLRKLRAVPQPTDSAPLAELITRIENAATDMSGNHQALNQIERELAVAKQALRQWAVENRICPTCGGKIDPERLVASVEVGLGEQSHG
jgi:exonuclease SbcC